MITSVVLRRKWKVNKMGIEMSCAFDTIRRNIIFKPLKDVGCTNDEIRLVKFWFYHTNLKSK